MNKKVNALYIPRWLMISTAVLLNTAVAWSVVPGSAIITPYISIGLTSNRVSYIEGQS